MNVSFSLRRIVAAVEEETNTRFTNADIVRELGLHRHTVAAWMSDEGVTAVTGETVAAIIAFCTRHGVPFDANDLFVIER